ncbi:hypothetical protein BaRGS_00033307 [Batillaria attramentaria]|uniref:Uncharacterized protein n=1 Tax=Batillaria attramentaria TaxID=370345 RepID=A0ABD0JL74_9CAEN
MSWKCVLVGLVLVLPGTLLNVEGRYSEQNSEPEQGDSFIESLINYFNQEQRLNRQQYARANGEEARQKKFDTENTDDGIAKDAQDGGGKDTASSQGGTKTTTAHAEPPKALPIQAKHLIVSGCSVLGAVGIIMAGVCWYKYHKGAKAASDVEYPAYGVTGPTKDRLPSPGDRKLAQSAQMYHYQHQKQQMIAMEKANGDMKHDASDDESEEDNVEGDYTVYECPGLAPTGEMEVKNPLFRGDETPGTPGNDDQRPDAGN